jgi:MFS family permease
MNCILVGLPIWYSLAILVTFSPEIAKALGVVDPIIAGTSVFWFYCGITIGSVANGLFSQMVGSRKLSIGAFLFALILALGYFFHAPILDASAFYTIIFVIGFCTAYWAMMVTVAAEQFGTNLRATVATSVPNFVRGFTVPITMIFALLKDQFGLGIVEAAEIVGIGVAVIAIISLIGLRETFHVDLDYIETDKKPDKEKT